jgi:transcriptional regulator with XRE-family HTH domain
MQIGEVIRKYRLDKNITQEEMAGRSPCSQQVGK